MKEKETILTSAAAGEAGENDDEEHDENDEKYDNQHEHIGMTNGRVQSSNIRLKKKKKQPFNIN